MSHKIHKFKDFTDKLMRKILNIFKNKRKFISGFTLLELLVVVSIIVILITMGMSSYATAQKKGRDAKRKGDIKDVQAALEQYYSVCGYSYPVTTGFYSSIICTTPGISVAIMPTVPTDPRGTTPYYCSGTCNSSGYTICANLESETPSTFCVTNQQ